MFSSSFQRLTPSREAHQSSNVPISVTRDSKRTGKTVPCWPSSLSVTSSGLSSSISLPQFSRRSPTRSCFRIVELRRSEEHTSELQSQFHIVCRLLLEKK